MSSFRLISSTLLEVNRWRASTLPKKSAFDGMFERGAPKIGTGRNASPRKAFWFANLEASDPGDGKGVTRPQIAPYKDPCMNWYTWKLDQRRSSLEEISLVSDRSYLAAGGSQRPYSFRIHCFGWFVRGKSTKVGHSLLLGCAYIVKGCQRRRDQISWWTSKRDKSFWVLGDFEKSKAHLYRGQAIPSPTTNEYWQVCTTITIFRFVLYCIVAVVKTVPYLFYLSLVSTSKKQVLHAPTELQQSLLFHHGTSLFDLQSFLGLDTIHTTNHAIVSLTEIRLFHQRP